MSNLLYSLILHSFVFILLFFSIEVSQIRQINQTSQAFTAYLQLTQKKNKISEIRKERENIKNKEKKENKDDKNKDTRGSHLKNNQSDNLLILLHTAIENAQSYPESAQEMEREGIVSVEFILNINGSIHDLNLLHSSGTSSLDEAALEAVKKAAPFQHVEKYLSGPQKFTINIVFKL